MYSLKDAWVKMQGFIPYKETSSPAGLFQTAFIPMCHGLAHLRAYFVAMVTYYCKSLEEALRRAKAAAKRPGYHYGGITLKSGRKGFGVYRDSRLVEMYSAVYP